MRFLLPALTGVWLLSSCKQAEKVDGAPAEQAPEAAAASEELSGNFPLLPLIEATLWKQLLAAESRLHGATESDHKAAQGEVDRLVEKLRRLHPFEQKPDRVKLGEITFDKTRQCFSLPAQVSYPDPGDERHPGEVELLLCTEGGRRHETLFVSRARPLHLELLLHLAGHGKGPNGSRFRMDVITRDGARIAVHDLIRSSEPVDHPLVWEFSGSDYKDLYSPDLSGDMAIFWHAHESVLRVRHPGIASGVVKLSPVPHPQLKNGDPVTLEIVPIGT